MFTTSPNASASPDSGRDPIATTASPVFTAALTWSRPIGPASIQVLHRVHDPQPGPDRSLGVVAVSHRRAEDGHDRVADEFLDRSPEPLDLLFRTSVEALQGIPNVLRICLVRSRREAHQVDEEHRDELALLPRTIGREQFCAARRAERGVERRLSPATRAR